MEGTLEKVGKISELTFELRLVWFKKKRRSSHTTMRYKSTPGIGNSAKMLRLKCTWHA